MTSRIAAALRLMPLVCSLTGACASGHGTGVNGNGSSMWKPLPLAALDVTNGKVEALDQYKASVRVPSMRAVMKAPDRSAVALDFTYLGPSEKQSYLASGEVRHQLGLKLRAADTCNLLYVMWRVGASSLDVSQKYNPGSSTHEQCRDHGYRRIRPAAEPAPLPELRAGESHRLAASIRDRTLEVRVDGTLTWVAELTPQDLTTQGPAGIRTDNVQVDFVMSSPEQAR